MTSDELMMDDEDEQDSGVASGSGTPAADRSQPEFDFDDVADSQVKPPKPVVTDTVTKAAAAVAAVASVETVPGDGPVAPELDTSAPEASTPAEEPAPVETFGVDPVVAEIVAPVVIAPDVVQPEVVEPVVVTPDVIVTPVVVEAPVADAATAAAEASQTETAQHVESVPPATEPASAAADAVAAETPAIPVETPRSGGLFDALPEVDEETVAHGDAQDAEKPEDGKV